MPSFCGRICTHKNRSFLCHIGNLVSNPIDRHSTANAPATAAAPATTVATATTASAGTFAANGAHHPSTVQHCDAVAGRQSECSAADAGAVAAAAKHSTTSVRPNGHADCAESVAWQLPVSVHSAGVRSKPTESGDDPAHLPAAEHRADIECAGHRPLYRAAGDAAATAVHCGQYDVSGCNDWPRRFGCIFHFPAFCGIFGLSPENVKQRPPNPIQNASMPADIHA